MSKQRRYVYIAVIAAGGGFLLVDSFIMSEPVMEPQQASGATTETPDAAQPTDAAPVELRTIPELPFPYSVQAYALSTEIPDLFAPPGARSGRKPDGASDKSGIPAPGMTADGRLDRTSFGETHVLDGVLDQERLRIAIVDGNWLRPGDVLDGCTLKTVAGSQAGFECHDGEIVLRFGDKTARTRD